MANKVRPCGVPQWRFAYFFATEKVGRPLERNPIVLSNQVGETTSPLIRPLLGYLWLDGRQKRKPPLLHKKQRGRGEEVTPDRQRLPPDG